MGSNRRSSEGAVLFGRGDPKSLQFGSTTLYKGGKVIYCENEESKEFLVTTVAGIHGFWQSESADGSGQ